MHQQKFYLNKSQLARAFNLDVRTVSRLHMISDATDACGRALFSYENARKQIAAYLEARSLKSTIAAAKAAKLSKKTAK